jgi:hypothetical protein
MLVRLVCPGQLHRTGNALAAGVAFWPAGAYGRSVQRSGRLTRRKAFSESRKNQADGVAEAAV